MAEYVLGPKDTPSPVLKFHHFLTSKLGEIPLSPQWVCAIDTLPTILHTSLTDSAVGLELNDWFVSHKTTEIINSIEKGLFLDGSVCIYVQGIESPREVVNTERIVPSNGFHGGLMGAPVSKGRNPISNINIVLLETSNSFIDFVIRPWTIYTSHYGLVARRPDDPKNIKTDLRMIYFDRDTNVRKIFTYYNAAPVSCDGQQNGWDSIEVQKAITSWVFTHYDVKSLTPRELNNLEGIRIENPSSSFSFDSLTA